MRLNKGHQQTSVTQQLFYMAFHHPKWQKLYVMIFVTSIVLNFYLFWIHANSQYVYESIDHLNAVSNIKYETCSFEDKPLIMKEIHWDLITNKHAICLCGVDSYCRCGPSAATDIIAFTPDMKQIVLVDRGVTPFGIATVGGFIEVGESIEQGAIREYKEETNLDINDLMQVHTYSNPNQDPRRPAFSTTFIAKIKQNEHYENMHAGDDAKRIIKLTVKEAQRIMHSEYDEKFGFEVHRVYIYDALQMAKKLNWL